MNNPAFQGDDDQPQRNPGMELQSPGAREDRGDRVVVADCRACCLPLPFLNYFRSPKWFLVFLSLAATVQGICINGLVNVVITSIERRFSLQSTQSGTIASSYDIGSLVIMIPVSYLGGRLGSSKPRWIAGGMLTMALGSLVWTIPHFATDPYSAAAAGSEEEGGVPLCRAGGSLNQCSKEEEGETSLSSYRFVFVFGQLLHGVGAAPLITLGTTFLDESVSKRSSPLYIAVFQTWFVIGPAIGYVLGGSLLSIHTDLVESSLSSSSSLWVGAWWPGFFLTFLLSLSAALVLQCYPASINTKRDTTLRTKESEGAKLKPVHHALVALLMNPTYIFISLGGGVDGLIVSGLSAFLPKFIEQQYRLTNGAAAQLVGLIVVPGGGGGTFFGGWLIKRLNLTRNGIINMCFLSQILTIPLLFAYFFTCSGPTYVGLHHLHTSLPSPPNSSYYPSLPFSPSPSDSRFTSQCNSACSCPDKDYDPVCGSDNLMYVSPCFAGCSSNVSANNFTDCACVEGGTAERKSCDSECGFLIPYIILQFLGIFMTFLATMPSVVASLRAVHPEERSLALGLQSMILRIVGSIPGPILFGAFMDKACILWEESCDGQGSCLVYDNYQMATSMIGICVVAKSVSIICFALGRFFSGRSSIIDIPEGETKDDISPSVQQQEGGATNQGLQGEGEEKWKQAYVPYEEAAS